MELVAYHKMRTAVQENAFPGARVDVVTVASSLRELLESTGMFETVEVERTENPDALVIALVQFRPEFTESDVAARLEQLWNDRVRYEFWEAHTLLVDEEHVEFEAATRAGTDGHYVTLHLVAQKARIPMQRTASPF